MVEERNQNNNQEKKGSNWQSLLVLITIGLILIITAVVFYPDARQKMLESVRETPNNNLGTIEIPLEEPDQTPVSTQQVEQNPTPSPEVYAQTSQFGSLVLALQEGVDIHLYLYRPFLENSTNIDLTALQLTKITTGSHQNITPAINPDGTKIAFSSNRSGYWDIFILDLTSGEITQFTDSKTYDGYPTWSPDGQWLAFESYQQNNLDIYIQDINQSSGPLPLTNHPAADHSPNWSGQGRKISFISTRDGKEDVWYADLDSPQADKAVKVPRVENLSVGHPIWSADGRYLTWSIISPNGTHSLVTWDSTQPEYAATLSGAGDWPVWGDAGNLLYSVINTPYESYLTAYPAPLQGTQVMLPALRLPGNLEGISWAKNIIVNTELVNGGQVDFPSLWTPINLNDEAAAEIQVDLITLRNLEAPYPQFIEEAVSTYSSLRGKTRELSGWDFLSTLEQAYVPPESPLELGINLNWLHSGRGMMINDIPRLAEWLTVIREDYGDQTFWRVYIKTNDQSGHQGKPIKNMPWNFDARYSGNNEDYENGGAWDDSIPDGYWLDFTKLAALYGWFRFPAIPYWQFSETASRYQYFAFTQELSLESALLQLYPPQDVQKLIGTSYP